METIVHQCMDTNSITLGRKSGPPTPSRTSTITTNNDFKATIIGFHHLCLQHQLRREGQRLITISDLAYTTTTNSSASKLHSSRPPPLGSSSSASAITTFWSTQQQQQWSSGRKHTTATFLVFLNTQWCTKAGRSSGFRDSSYPRRSQHGHHHSTPPPSPLDDPYSLTSIITILVMILEVSNGVHMVILELLTSIHMVILEVLIGIHTTILDILTGIHTVILEGSIGTLTMIQEFLAIPTVPAANNPLPALQGAHFSLATTGATALVWIPFVAIVLIVLALVVMLLIKWRHSRRHQRRDKAFLVYNVVTDIDKYGRAAV
ncbi:hypothetical protein SELMODRAFT_429353 [Selaginella moellendorffii]|uniref:Uncharacterized protein n=1 Tax=Selaginella moellendorffii TaxID=88036 RepID=D8T5W4_SELML|nr:hypothetical protein SELMODRAFT_429353 [Selaginella moellendorffii]